MLIESLNSERANTRLHTTYLRPDQTDQIARTKEFRREADSLRALIASRGWYGVEEAARFWALARNASFALHIANPELAERAGLGSGFFTSVARDKRKPKLENFLRALAVIIEVANERLSAIDDIEDAQQPEIADLRSPRVVFSEHEQLQKLAASLAQMAQQEVNRIKSNPANYPESIEEQRRQIDLLEIFAVGFNKIAQALLKFGAGSQEETSFVPVRKAVSEVVRQLDTWWAENAGQAIDWAIRIPAIVGGIAALGWAGANMTVGTTVIAALVGGPKVAEVISKRKRGK